MKFSEIELLEVSKEEKEILYAIENDLIQIQMERIAGIEQAIPLIFPEDRDGHDYESIVDAWLILNQAELDRLAEIKQRVDIILQYDNGCPALNKILPAVPNVAHFLKVILPSLPDWNTVLTNLESAHAEIIAERNANSYKELRQKEYPSLNDMTVALWESVVENRHEAKEALQAKRVAVKAKYPKP